MDASLPSLLKYPRTPHLEGSRLQAGDEGHDQVPYRALAGQQVVVEEKLDGANTGVSFSAALDLLLQSRGHYLLGGPREKHFDLFKRWARCHEDRLFDLLGTRYVMFGEWLNCKHTVFYDQLPHYFQEFDLWDREAQCFLSTAAREAVLGGSVVQSVPVLYRGAAPQRLEDLLAWIGPSLAKSVRWRERLAQVAAHRGLAVDRVLRETENSQLSEGLYIKVEAEGQVIARYKWVRHDFLQTLMEGDSHWQARPIVPNQLMDGVNLFAPTAPYSWDALARLRAQEALDAVDP